MKSLCRVQGLRTLVLGTKILQEEVWADWDSRYQDAAAQLDNRDEALAALAVEIEADLEMVGVTAIEDKLQEGVPAAIQSLLNAGMKVQTQLQHGQSRGHPYPPFLTLFVTKLILAGIRTINPFKHCF